MGYSVTRQALKKQSCNLPEPRLYPLEGMELPALRLLEEDVRFRKAVQEGIAQADRGEFIEEEEMDALLEQMLRS